MACRDNTHASGSNSDCDNNESCPICLYPLIDSHSLPCGHKGCLICFEYLFAQLSPSDRCCPVCKQSATKMLSSTGENVPMPSPAPEPAPSSTRKKIKFDSPITVSHKSSTVTFQDQPETGLDLNHSHYTYTLRAHTTTHIMT